MANLTEYDADNRLITQGIDHGDGTGTLITYDPETGDEVSSVAWEPLADPVNPAQEVVDLAAAAADAATGLPADNPLRLAIEALAAATQSTLGGQP